jgi:CRP-like cAMP-binding protein
MAASSIEDHPIVRQLNTIASLSEPAKQAVAGLPMHVVSLEADQEILREGDRSSQCYVILEGFVANFKITATGKRQIVAYYLAGDIPDLQSLHLPVLDSSWITITPCKVGFIQHENLHRLCERHPDITKVLWRWTLIAASIYREWVTNVGQRNASARVAHLLCEVITRMRAVGLTRDYTCEFAMTQTELADATGMSTVHINRTLQELRRAKLITLKENTLTAIDWEGLQEAGEFDPAYLHIRNVAH